VKIPQVCIDIKVYKNSLREQRTESFKKARNHCTRWWATSGPSRFPLKNCTFKSFCNYSAIL